MYSSSPNPGCPGSNSSFVTSGGVTIVSASIGVPYSMRVALFMALASQEWTGPMTGPMFIITVVRDADAGRRPDLRSDTATRSAKEHHEP